MPHRNIKFADIAIAFHNETSEIAISTNLPMIPYIRVLSIMIINVIVNAHILPCCCYYVNNENMVKGINSLTICPYFQDGIYYGPDNGNIKVNHSLIKVNNKYWAHNATSGILWIYENNIYDWLPNISYSNLSYHISETFCSVCTIVDKKRGVVGKIPLNCQNLLTQYPFNYNEILQVFKNNINAITIQLIKEN